MVDADERTINEVFRPYAMTGRPYMMGVGFDNDGNLIGPWTVKLLPGPVNIRKLGVKQFFGFCCVFFCYANNRHDRVEPFNIVNA